MILVESLSVKHWKVSIRKWPKDFNTGTCPVHWDITLLILWDV